jgi:hypothetical protein
MSTTVLVHAHAAHIRLAIMDGLRDRAQVIPGGTDPLRTLRAHRPEVVLVAVRRRDRRQTLALARSLKTDGRSPPLLGLIDPGGVLSDPKAACERAEADGCLQGPVDEPGLAALLEGLRGAELALLGEASSVRTWLRR